MGGPRNPKWVDMYVPNREEITADTEGPSRTRQEFAAECDINTIMAQYERTGVISHFNDGVPKYLDMTNLPVDLQASMAILDEARASFMRLPAKVRREFDNDVHAFVAFAENGDNLDKMREWGLAPPAELPDAPREPAPPAPEPPAK